MDKLIASASLSKDQALSKYKDALGLKLSTPILNWLEVFPEASDLRDFWADIKDFSWPNSYGSSPWHSLLTDLAYQATEGVSIHDILFLQKELKSQYSGRVEDAKKKIFLMRQYGIIGRDTEAQIWNPEPFERNDLFDFLKFAQDHQEQFASIPRRFETRKGEVWDVERCWFASLQCGLHLQW